MKDHPAVVWREMRLQDVPVRVPRNLDLAPRPDVGHHRCVGPASLQPVDEKPRTVGRPTAAEPAVVAQGRGLATRYVVQLYALLFSRVTFDGDRQSVWRDASPAGAGVRQLPFGARLQILQPDLVPSGPRGPERQGTALGADVQ